MSVVHNTNTSGDLDHFSVSGNGVFLSSHAEGGATFVDAAGEIDASNIHYLTDYMLHYAGGGRPVIVDLTELDFLGAQGIPALFHISERFGEAGVEWALVPSHSVRRLLRICDTDGRLPAVSSIDEALERFSSQSRTRRLFQLVTKTG